MTWRGHAWELTVGAASWLVAIGALVLVLALVAYDAAKARRQKGSAP